MVQRSGSPRSCGGTGTVSLWLVPARADSPAAKPRPPCRDAVPISCRPAHRQTFAVRDTVGSIHHHSLLHLRPDKSPEAALTDWPDSTLVVDKPGTHSTRLVG